MFPVGVDLVAADVSRIARIDSLVRERGDAAVRFGYDKRVAPIDRNQRRADINFNCHSSIP